MTPGKLRGGGGKGRRAALDEACGGRRGGGDSGTGPRSRFPGEHAMARPRESRKPRDSWGPGFLPAQVREQRAGRRQGVFTSWGCSGGQKSKSKAAGRGPLESGRRVFLISSAGTIGHAQRKKMKPDPRFMSPICRSILNGYINVKSKIIKL